MLVSFPTNFTATLTHVVFKRFVERFQILFQTTELQTDVLKTF